MNITQLILLILFSVIGSYAGRYAQAMFSSELGRLASNGARTFAFATVYALVNSVVVFLLASLVGIGISILFWFVLILVFELVFNSMR